MPFIIVRNDITKMSVDAIVNTANPLPIIGDGTDKAIHMAAGPGLLAARMKIGNILRGQAAITPAFNLDADYVIHTAGPFWIDGQHNEDKTLEACYRNSLDLALQRKCESIAFPLISSGSYGFPRKRALKIATKAISDYVLRFDITVYLVVFDNDSYMLSSKLFKDVASYISDNYVEEQIDAEYSFDSRRELAAREEAFFRDRDLSPEEQPRLKHRRRFSEAYSARHEERECLASDISVCADIPVCHSMSFEDVDWNSKFKNMDESFSKTLIRLIAEKGMTNAQAYKKANIDKKHFAKIKNNINYQPTKYTVLAFAIALKLDMKETKSLMEKAGLALSKCNKFDVIVSFFIETRQYNIFDVNEVLFEYDQPLLGC